MRREEISVNASSYYYGQMVLEYPDEVVFVFNPLYLNIELGQVMDTYRMRRLNLSISTGANNLGTSKKIEVTLYKGKARVYLSKLMELFFDDVRFERSKTLYLNLMTVGNNVVFKSISFIAIWGNLAVGERFSHYGAFKLDKNRPYFERKRIWFKNFPFTVSMFAHGWGSKDRGVSGRYDGNPYQANLNVHYPPVWGTINSIEDEDIDGPYPATTVISADYLEGAVFDKQEQKFYGSTDDYTLYENWTAGRYMPGPEEYNSRGKARTDRVWSMPNGRLVRYDAQIGDLVEVPYGRSHEIGIYEINPALAFSNAQRTVTLKQKGEQTEVKSSTFDESFDYTFWMANEMSTITILEIDNSTTGHYLRWIDRFGMFQYFLFVKGKQSLKNKLGSNTVVEDYTVGGMYFANHERTTHIEGTRTYKGCAVSLREEIYDYVASIITSPIIDLYVGKTRFGDEMWVPVNIVASDHSFDPQSILHDLEISFTLPPVNAQTL